MKTQHTPGPWKIGDRLNVYCESLGTWVADCNRITNFSDENIANARLIAAAPDLLFTIESIKTRAETMFKTASHAAEQSEGTLKTNYQHEYMQWAEIIDRCSTALNKAKGE